MIITSDEYHAHPAIGSTTAKLAIKSMQLFRDAQTGVYVQPDKPAYQIGRLAHMMILEPERFARCVVTEGPINPATGKGYARDTNKFAKWQAENPDITVVEPWLFTMLERMPEKVRALFCGGVAESSYFTNLEGVPVKCRPDYLRGTQILDVKTIDDVDQRDRAIVRNKYWVSAAWYRAVMRAVTGKSHSFRLIFCEKKPPFRWRIVTLEADYVMLGDSSVAQTIQRIGRAMKSGDWSDHEDIEVSAAMPNYLEPDLEEDEDDA